MNNSIYREQNTELVLKCLTMQRKSYQKAKIFYALYVLVGIVFSVTMTILQLFIEDKVLLGISIIGFVIIVSLGRFFKSKSNFLKNRGAKIQEYINCKLYWPEDDEMLSKTFSDEEIASIISKCDNIDPSVENWYQDYSNLTHTNQVFCCQKTDIRWDGNLREKYTRLCIISSMIILVLALAITVFLNLSVVTVICNAFYGSSLILFAFESFWTLKDDSARLENIKVRLTVMESLFNKIEESEFVVLEKDLQKEIFAHRREACLIPTCFYKKFYNKQELEEVVISRYINNGDKNDRNN